MHRIIFAFTAMLLLGSLGCATREVRLQKNATLLQQFSEEQQELIRAGRIEVGFTKDMVFLAWGKPSRISTRVSEERSNEIWTYTAYRTNFSNGGYYGGYHYAHSRHCGAGFYPLHVSTYSQQEYDRMKVVFSEEKVVSYESVN